MELPETHSDTQADGRTGRAGPAILRAGIELFGRQGFGATSLRQIAAAAGVTPPLVAYHFGSKEGLFDRCIAAVSSALATVLVDEVQRASDLRDMVRRLAVAHLDFPQQHPAAVRLLLTAAYAPEQSQPAVDFAAPWAGTLERVAGRFDAGIADGSFRPRGTACPFALTRHLFNLLHMAVFAECRSERICPRLGNDPRFAAPGEDPVEELCNQFFLGAGDVVNAESPNLEDAR